MSPTADVRSGDLLVTSGLDGTYPQGLAVARVASVERDTGQMFARITVAPVGGVDAASNCWSRAFGRAAAAAGGPGRDRGGEEERPRPRGAGG